MADYNEIKNDAKTRMEKSLESLKADFGGLRAGRAHASLLDGILVEAYGSMTPLSQRSWRISARESRSDLTRISSKRHSASSVSRRTQRGYRSDSFTVTRSGNSSGISRRIMKGCKLKVRSAF